MTFGKKTVIAAAASAALVAGTAPVLGSGAKGGASLCVAGVCISIGGGVSTNVEAPGADHLKIMHMVAQAGLDECGESTHPNCQALRSLHEITSKAVGQ